MSQKERILEYLKKGNSLTTASAVDLFKIYRLSERIRELENDGHAILHENETTLGGARIVRYWLYKPVEIPVHPFKRQLKASASTDFFPDRTNRHSEFI